MMTSTTTVDVVIVGGGIAGATLGKALADDDLSVVVLERSEQYADHVRGESLMPWGVREAQTLGVAETLLAAGAHVTTTWIGYFDEVPAELSEKDPVPVGAMLPGVPGSLNLRHPVACEALAVAAAGAGAPVRRGVTSIEVTLGSSPEVSFVSGRVRETLRCRLVVGADGRNSTVRRQSSIAMRKAPPRHVVAGLLLDDVTDVPSHDVFAAGGDLFLAGFNQGGGCVRLYLCPSMSQRHLFAGGDQVDRFLRLAVLECVPYSERFGAARPAGPCATYSAENTWVDEPFGDGVVLVGDAAGYSNPIIGQGLATAMRDVRIVRDILRAGDWSPSAFVPYRNERAERSRRIAYNADVVASGFAEDADDRSVRRTRILTLKQEDPLFLALFASTFAGPETAPEEAFDGRFLATITGRDSDPGRSAEPAVVDVAGAT